MTDHLQPHSVDPDVMKQFGEICFLVTQSQLHRNMAFKQIEARLFHPLRIGQGRVFSQGANKPIAYVSWAFVSDEVDAALMKDPNAIRPDEWNSGHNLWFMEFIAPYGRVREMVAYLDQHLFNAVSYAKLHRVDANGQQKRIARYYGSQRRRERSLA
ncbi:toxin-activating lysine-acyltransferase [Ruegeria sp.]|uniref:toxin-activating lysine-acyltransferase n=1 Tax=Ruegeria sp. TaxID=1879320 RepID=UPI00230AE01B|nr:toxin-activating lysine-acyltransferase [Ruegeria sp.]MDA7965356.1 toxin-activating lysine-acyltransferase [Ruegeria sp.]